ncbi:uncharacterized protein TNCV_1835601 [Trichonephila clavipes]|nr:uncharacterized protein TNCV_1835601 [Trichonephila clavipes]
MALEYPSEQTRSTFIWTRFGKYTQLPNLENRQSAFHIRSSATLTKSNGVVWVFRVFYSWPVFFEELGAGGPVTCSITGHRYASLLRNKIISDLQARQCLSCIIFMQDGAPPHITRCVTDVLKHHFTEERVISRQFRHLWPVRSPDLNPCDFWLWDYLKQLVSCDQPKTLPDLKDSISRHVRNISQNTLRSTVEHTILRFQILAENDGHHVEHLLL